jgi:hypothetical protein
MDFWLGGISLRERRLIGGTMRKYFLSLIIILCFASFGFAGQRYYDLDANGKVKGSYANLQKGLTLYLLDESPDNMSMRDGVPGSNWIADQEAVDAASLASLKKSATLEPYDQSNALQNLINVLIANGTIKLEDLDQTVSDKITAISAAQTQISTKMQPSPGVKVKP